MVGSLLGVAGVAGLAACAIKETIEAPACEGDTSVIIVAQSVPGASKVMCLDPLPRGWEYEEVKIDESGTRIELDSDRAGSASAIMHYTATCDTGDALSTPSEFPGVLRYERIRAVAPAFVADRYYTFEGGCLWWRFEFDPEVPSGLSVELGGIVQMADREVLSDNVRETFVDEEL